MNKLLGVFHRYSPKKRKQALAVGLFVFGLCGIAWGVMQYTRQHYTQLAEQASLEYDTFLKTLGQDAALAKIQGDALIQAYPKTPYAQLVSLALATSEHQQQHLEAAKTYLKSLLKEQGPVVHIARLRLARLLSQEQDYEAALALLSVQKPGHFDMLYQEITGDIYWQQAQFEKAKTAYAAAIQATPAGISSAWLQLKHRELGGDNNRG